MAVAEGRIDVPNVNQYVVLRRPAKAKKAAKAAKSTPKAAKVAGVESKSEVKENAWEPSEIPTPPQATSSSD
jgi:hypothetical protein